MQKSKKTEPITFRTSKETKDWLDYFAEEKDWTISQLVERTISAWVEDQKKILKGEQEEDDYTEEEEEY